VSTPEENLRTAVDESTESDARERAIDELETANECDTLAELVRNADLEERYRERALTNLAHPQCKRTLRSLVDDGDVPESLRDRAETLLEETPDDAGAGP
jgi:hypothetical protein